MPSGFLSGMANPTGLSEFQSDSDSLPLNVLYYQAIEGHGSPGGFNLWSDDNYQLLHYKYFPTGKPHVSHYALETRVYSAFSPRNAEQVPHYVDQVRLILRALLAAMLALFVAAITRETSLAVGLALAFLLAITTGLVVVAGSLFWAAFTFQAPISIIWFFYPLARRRYQQVALGVVILGLLLVRFLCSWEYCTVIAGMVVTAVFYYGLKASSNWWRALLPVFVYGALGAVAFFVSYGINASAVAQLSRTYPELNKAFKNRAGQMSSFTASGTSEINDWQQHRPKLYEKLLPYGIEKWRGTFWDRLAYSIRNVCRILVFAAVAIPFTGHSIPLGLVAPAMLALMVWVTRSRTAWSGSTQTWLWTTWASLLASLTWPLLMSGHFQGSNHLVPMMLSFGWIPISYVLLLQVAREAYEKRHPTGVSRP